jgi:cell shape-determining protein MreC
LENSERKAKQLEAENKRLEKELDEKKMQYAAVKAELDQTLKDLEGL